jgi:hypothetical protein
VTAAARSPRPPSPVPVIAAAVLLVLLCRALPSSLDRDRSSFRSPETRPASSLDRLAPGSARLHRPSQTLLTLLASVAPSWARSSSIGALPGLDRPAVAQDRPGRRSPVRIGSPGLLPSSPPRDLRPVELQGPSRPAPVRPCPPPSARIGCPCSDLVGQRPDLAAHDPVRSELAGSSLLLEI